MKAIRLSTLHRHVGITLAPFLLVQGSTGILLGLFNSGGNPRALKGAIAAQEEWISLLVTLHFGPGVMHRGYLLLLGTGLLWMVCSGTALFLRVRRARSAANNGNMNRNRGVNGP